MKEYLYVINYPKCEEDLCLQEMRSLFKEVPKNKVLISNRKFNPSNSSFIKKRLEIIYKKETLADIIVQLEKNKITLENFKIECIKIQNLNIAYTERLQIQKEIGNKIFGNPSIKNPKQILGITKYDGNWIFGICCNSNFKSDDHDKKPFSYSNALSTRVAKAIVNIANEGNPKIKIVDACCGVGTTLIEGLSAGYDICGYDINPKVVSKAKKNLRYFGLEEKVTNEDMTKITTMYDCCIVDIPYGLFSHTSKELQQGIIDAARRISKKMILITFENLNELLHNSNFKIIDKCTVQKGTFVRTILVCI